MRKEEVLLHFCWKFAHYMIIAGICFVLMILAH
jgi:hypothetical protein